VDRELAAPRRRVLDALAEVLPRVACPVLALHGALDEYGSTRHPELIGERCGGWRSSLTRGTSRTANGPPPCSSW